MEGRKIKAIKNMLCGFAGQFITIILGFINRTIFLHCFTAEYVGISSLFTSIFSLLSLADLGMEASMTVKLYKPLAINDKEKIKSIMDFYKHIFIKIMFVIIFLGIILLPFIKKIVKIPTNVSNVEIIYLLSLMNSAVTYLLIYRKILLIADQKKYITDIVQYCFTIAESICLIPILLLTKSYILYLIIQIVFKIAYNLLIMHIATNKYKFLSEKCIKKISLNDKKNIKSDMISISLHRIGDVVNSQSWTILASMFVSVKNVGMYANYQIIFNYVKVLMDKVFYSLSPSIGNLIVTEDKKTVIKFFNRMLFISFSLTLVCGTCLLCLTNNFITIWIGEKYLLGMEIVLISVFNFYLVNMRKTVLIFKEAYGLFKQDKIRPIIESIITIILSCIFASIQNMKLFGILMGSNVSYLLMSFWIEPYILYKNGFKESPLKYYQLYIKYFFHTFIVFSLCLLLCYKLKNNIMFLFIKLVISLLTSLLWIVIFFRTTDEFKWVKKFLLELKGKGKLIWKRKKIST